MNYSLPRLLRLVVARVLAYYCQEKTVKKAEPTFIPLKIQFCVTLDPHHCKKSPLRRHSFSAPSQLCVDRLDIAVKHLGQRILSLSTLVSTSTSPSPQPVDSLLFPNKMTRICHGCHAPIDDDHKDYPTGWQKCPLDHWSGCLGGVVEGKAANGSEWRGCPQDYVHVEAVTDGSDEELDNGLNKEDISIINGDEANGAGAGALDKDQTDVVTNLEIVEEIAKKGLGEELVDEARLILQYEEANKLLKQQAATRAKEGAAAQGRKLEMLKAENLRLSQAMGGDIGGAKVRKVPHPKDLKLGVSRNPVQEHLSRRDHRASEFRPEDDSLYTGINMKGIRKIPVLQTQVDKLVGKVQSRAPSLDRRPSFIGVRDSSLAPQHTEVAPEFVYRECEDGTMRKVRTPQSRDLLPVPRPGQIDGLDTSSDEDCDVEPQPGNVFKWWRDENGEKYFTEEKQVRQQQQEMVYRYVKDEATGRSYKRLVLKDDPDRELVSQWVIDPETGLKVKMLVPSQLGSTKPKIGQQSSSHLVRFTSSPGSRSQAGDGFTTPLPLSVRRRSSQHSSTTFPPRNLSDLKDDKQGKMPTIIQFARNCPVSWTSKITSDKLNMGLWCWSYMAELLATRTGQADPLPSGELEARMQHFLNVLEVALQPSAPTDFDNHGWKVARLYAEKVQHKVERGDTWLSFEQRYGSDSQPHELMAAEKELAPKGPKVPKQPKDEEVKIKDGEKKKTCTTWNSSSTEGKCEFEVQYEG